MRRPDLVVGVAVGLLAAGVAARFVDLDRHYYFHDEAVTSLRVSGHTYADVARVATGPSFTAADIAAYQHPTGRGLWATIHSLAIDDPQHPPLFYVVARLWAEVVGSSMTSMRALAAVLSLLALAAAAWLAWELFGSRRVVWLALALLAISPFQLLYAREAREYSLWVAAVAASSAGLLLALRTRSRAAWLLYAVLLAAGLYTFPNTALVALGHAVFLLLDVRRREVLRPFAVALLAAFVLYLPWIGVMVLERGAFSAGTGWAGDRAPFTELLRSWLVVSGLPVLDKPEGGSSLGAFWGVALAAVVLLEAAALLVVRRRAPRRAWLFLASLIGAAVLPLMLADVVLGGVRSTVPRFLAPAYLGLSVGSAFALATLVAAPSLAKRLGACVVAVALVAAAVTSYERSAFASVWWNQDDGAAAENLATARALDRVARPVLVTTELPPLLELSHYLDPTTRVRVVRDNALLPAARAGSVYFYGRSRPDYPEEARSVRLELPCCGAGPSPRHLGLWRLSS